MCSSDLGIGSLLLDGLGDTIRVSLTEDSVYEIPVARAIADKVMSLWPKARPEAAEPADPIDPFHFNRRTTATLDLSSRCRVGPENPPRVIVTLPSVADLPAAAAALASPRLKNTPAEGLMIPVQGPGELGDLCARLPAAGLPCEFLEIGRAHV